MIAYLNTNNICRSRQLLYYFGEENDHDCQQCDVCLGQRQETNQQEQARQQIIAMLNDKKKHHVTQLRTILLPYEFIEAALEELMLEEQLYMEDGYLYIANDVS